jgi:feruloyl esterase
MAHAVRQGMEIGTVQLVAAGPASAQPGAPQGATVAEPVRLPAHCLVRGVIAPRDGVDVAGLAGKRRFGIGFELRLPLQWNGRFLFQGGAGLDGVAQAAIGPIANSAQPPALTRGFAIVSTDSGHAGSPIDATFGLDQQARIDYAYNALDKVTAEAKRLITAYYGRAPRHSYFMGCSNGGRQALVAAQRLPLEFDGIVAGDPAMSFSRLALGEVWNMRVLAAIAPRAQDGRPIYARAFSDDDLKLVREAVLKRCDALDGLADGLINDFRGCRFHPGALRCTGDKTGRCLSDGQVGALHALMTGPQTSAGASMGPSTTIPALPHPPGGACGSAHRRPGNRIRRIRSSASASSAFCSSPRRTRHGIRSHPMMSTRCLSASAIRAAWETGTARSCPPSCAEAG